MNSVESKRPLTAFWALLCALLLLNAICLFARADDSAGDESNGSQGKQAALLKNLEAVLSEWEMEHGHAPDRSVILVKKDLSAPGVALSSNSPESMPRAPLAFGPEPFPAGPLG